MDTTGEKVSPGTPVSALKNSRAKAKKQKTLNELDLEAAAFYAAEKTPTYYSRLTKPIWPQSRKKQPELVAFFKDIECLA